MAKLNVDVLNNTTVKYDGAIYAEAEHPILAGDIVKSSEDDVDDITDGMFYQILSVDGDDDALFYDDIGDRRFRDHNDHDYTPYRKVSNPTATLTIDFPINLVIKRDSIASVTFA